VLGLALSVTVLVVVVSVINGFEREFRQRIFGVLPHLSFVAGSPFEVSPVDIESLESIPGIEAATPFVQGAGLAAVDKRVSGVMITGVDAKDHGRISRLGEFIEGRMPANAGDYEVALGVGVARGLGVGLGDRVTLVLPSASVTPAGLFLRQKRFSVSGLIASKSDLDAQAAYVHIGDAQKLFRLGAGIHGYQVRLQDLFMATELGYQGVEALGAHRVYPRPWMRTHGNLYQAIGMQKRIMFVLLSLLVAVAAFNLVSTLVMVVDQRSGDVAILRTLGADTATLVAVFVLLGVVLGGLGIGLGAICGALIATGLPPFYDWVAANIAGNLMNEYFINYLPVEVRLSDLVGIVVTAGALCLVSTVYPALRVAGLRPAEVLAHE
jgi:lipoprotein-releasing system permease protein